MLSWHLSFLSDCADTCYYCSFWGSHPDYLPSILSSWDLPFGFILATIIPAPDAFEKGNLANQYFFHRQLDISVTLGVIGSIPADYIIDFSFDLQTESDIFILRYSDYSVVESSLIDSTIEMDIAEDIRVSNITEYYILDVSDDELDNPPIPFLTPKTKSVNLLKLFVNPPGPFSTPKTKSVNILRQHQMVCLKALI